MNYFSKRSLLPVQYSLISFLLVTQIVVTCCHGCIDSERTALLSFKSSVTDPSDRLSTWQVGRHRNCCDWYGIQCSTGSLHVTSVDLRNVELETSLRRSDALPPNTLSGTISPSLLHLTHLQYLDLGFNDLDYTKIQYQFWKLKKLLHLDISYSQFSGSITTQFANLSSLQYLDVSKHVQDADPTSLSSSSSLFDIDSPSIDWVRELVNLRVLKLSGVDLSEASLTENWAKPISFLGDLRELHLSDCSISNPLFPTHEFLNLSHLSILKMNFNDNLNSSIPVQIANLTSLSVLELAGCFNLQGSIPYLPQIKRLDVRQNEHLQVNLSALFEGNNWPRLQELWISSTSVNGSIPSSISNAPALVSLYASDCSIKGSLPTAISALSQLEYLDLSANDITGYIPSSISSMKRLQYLSLSVNNLQGPIPGSICEISSLQQLNLDRNRLTGPIPSCITKLQSLRVFDISGNSVGGIVSLNSWISKLNLTELNLNNNSITVEIAQQPLPSQYHMEILKLQSCNIKGHIPAFFCKFTNLDTLELAGNNLTGAIPSCLFKHQKLRNLDLSRNKLQGTLPDAFHFDDSQFMSINLANNFLGGSLPVPSQMNMFFDLSQNQFTGGISFEVGERLSNARYASLSSNQLSGPIPRSFCSNKGTEDSINIEFLDLSNNTLTGNIPSSLGNCSLLSFLHLGMNNLTGEVPVELEQTLIRSLLLHDNLLEGTFPKFFQKFDLEALTLGNNNFEGNIPAFIGKFQYLEVLSLRSNKFNGSIPKDLSNLHQLQLLDLSLNNLSGKIHGNIGNLTTLTSRPNDTQALYSGGWSTTDYRLEVVIKGVSHYVQRIHGYNSGIDLSNNILEGNIPEEMGLLQGLSMLNLSNNNFHGKIPGRVGNMTGLESLDLSFNKLSGEIPREMVSLSNLGYLNLSYNNLSGRIPADVHFQTLGGDGSAYIGNDYLCGVPTKKHCDGDPIDPTGTNTDDNATKLNAGNEDGTRDKLLLSGSVLLGVAVGFWGLFLVLLCRKEKWWFVYWKVVDNVAHKITRCTWTNR